MFKLFIFLCFKLWLIISVVYATEPSQVCTVTINSDNEAKVFKKHLSEGKNKGNFEFLELTGKGNEYDFFQKSCEENIQCDLLIISGHFSGGFFSDKNNLKLSLEELEKWSCSKKCKGVFNRPTEVFLFGCNTLVSKGGDERPADEYFRGLLAHGMSLENAVRSTQEVYGVFGNSNRDTMKRIFQGVRNIYGFSGSGPLGNTVQPKLEKYFDSEGIKDYQNHLLEIESKRTIDGLEKMNTWVSDNDALKKVLSNTNFYQCSGAFPGIDDPILNDICALVDDKKSKDEKLALIQEMLTSINALKYAPSVVSFFNNNYPDNYQDKDLKLFQDLQKNETARDIFLKGVDKLDSVSEISFLHFLVMMDWMTPSEAEKREKKVVTQLLNPPITDFNRDSLCGYFNKFYEGFRDQPFYTLKYEDIPSSVYTSNNGVFVLGCLKMKDKRITTELEKKYSKYEKKSFDQKESFFRAIAVTEQESKSLDNFILEGLKSKNKEHIDSVIRLAGDNKSSNSQIQRKILDLNDFDYIPSYYLGKMNITDSKSLDRIIDIVFKEGKWDFFPCLVPLEERLNLGQKNKIGNMISNMSKKELEDLNDREWLMQKLPAELRTKAKLKMLDNNISWKYYADNEKPTPSDIEAYVEFLKNSSDSQNGPQQVLTSLSTSSIDEETLYDIFTTVKKKVPSYSGFLLDIVKNNIRKGSKVHEALIDEYRGVGYYGRAEIETLIMYEKINPTVKAYIPHLNRAWLRS